VFGTISPSGLITNVPAITLLATSLVAGFFRLCFGWIDILVDYGAQQQLVLFLSTLSNVAKLAGKLPLAHIQGISLSGFWATVVLSWVLWWSVAIRNRWRIWAAVPLLLFAITTNVRVPEDEVVVTTINVGHGTCHIIQQGKHTIMVDGGSKSNLDVGANTILPIGRQIGVTSIDVMVITHSDLDHIAGLVDVLRTIHVSKILLARQATQHQTPPLSWVLLEAQRLGIQVEMVSRGWQESVGDICLSILSPDQDEKYRSSNAASIVVLLQAHGRAILLTGDIDEQKIVELQKFLDSPIDILELPHHGQWSQESQELLNRLCPSIIIQSTNMSRHTRDKWSIPQNSSRFVTAVDGTLTTTVTQNGTITITGSKHPVSMPLCCVSN
jgi:competence protein ComEC